MIKFFKGNQYTCLGNKNEFRLNLLDFKKQIIIHNHFSTFSNYISKYGLHLNRKPIFFLHLVKDPYSNQNFRQVSLYQSQANSSQLVPSVSNSTILKNIKKEPDTVQPAKRSRSSSSSSQEIKYSKALVRNENLENGSTKKKWTE